MTDDALPDGLLLRRFRERGDEAAFVEIRRRHGRLVLATCRRETGDAALAEDAAQEAFLLLSRKSFSDETSLAGWLHSAARLTSRNALRMESRRARRERTAFEEAVEPVAAWNAVSPLIDEALAALRAKDREAVLLRYAGEMSLAEVGGALGIGENAARMCVTRALEKVRIHLRRTGVGISVALLATLLTTRLADANEPIVRPLPSSGRRNGRPWPKSPHRIVMAGLIGLLLLAGIIGTANALRSTSATRTSAGAERPVSIEDRARLFAGMTGRWSGRLEFADDRTSARTTSATTVVVRRTLDGGLRLIASYPNYAVVDTTEIAPSGSDRFTITTGGGSHRLDGTYELLQTDDGDTAFVGFSPSLRAQVRLRILASRDRLTVQEEYRREETYRFRNRFDLRRAE